MSRAHINDRLQFGLGQAARKLGAIYEVFRPKGAACPLARQNRIAKLNIALSFHDDRFRKPGGYGEPLWWGIADAKYLAPGDYITGPDGVFFMASSVPLAPALFVKTRRMLKISRPAAPSRTGLNGYGGVLNSQLVPLLTDWPAGFAASGQWAHGTLPGDVRQPNWSVLLPRLPATLRSSDVVEDDMGRRYVVSFAEESDLGWRLLVSQTAT